MRKRMPPSLKGKGEGLAGPFMTAARLSGQASRPLTKGRGGTFGGVLLESGRREKNLRKSITPGGGQSVLARFVPGGGPPSQ